MHSPYIFEHVAWHNCMQPPIDRLSCVIFDIDGTLARTSDLIFASFNHLASRHLGRRFEPAEIVALFGPPEEGAIEKVFGPEATPALMDELCAFYQEHHASMAALHGGVDGMLQFLKSRGVRLGVFTGKGSRTTRITLSSLGLSAYFDCVVTGNDVAHHKPHPEGILSTLERLRVPAGETIMVGDSLSDIKASRAAGVRMVLVLWDPYQGDRLRGEAADWVFETVEEMDRWVRACLNHRSNRDAT